VLVRLQAFLAGSSLCLLFSVISLLASSGFASSGFASNRPDSFVRANGENLLGSWTGEGERIAEFRGIPFAEPPVADLRWRTPVPHLPRGGQQLAREFAPACMQGSGGVGWYIGVAAAFGHGPEVVGRPVGLSEDCLYLNIWTPNPRNVAKLPVMVFVHGGSNSGGWAYEPNYLGARLAARGVVVVTISYRLGVFGFFSHPALNEDMSGPVANFGLLDIRAAFEWVRDHIGSFGGDPENVTAFGESAGAFDLVDLLVEDMGGGRSEASLFRRLISQSIGGSLVDRQTLAEEQATGVFLAGELGLGPNVTAASLRQVPADDLVRATQSLPEDHYFDAVIDGVTLSRQPMESLRRVQAAGVEVIAGTNADEWYMYISEDATRQDLEQWIETNAQAQRSALLALLGDDPDPRSALDRLRSAHSMVCPSRYLAQRVNESGGRAWVYYFSRRRAGEGGERLRAYHGAELPYVFNTHDEWLPTEEADRRLSSAIMDFWVQFASTGDPNGQGRPPWPVHTRQDPAVMELGDRLGVMEPMTDGLCGILGPEMQGGATSSTMVEQ